MSNNLTKYIEQGAIRLIPPQERAITDEVRNNYYIAIDKANEYHGNLDVLFEAMQLFQISTSAPLFCAGIAYIHMIASYQQGFAYSPYGMNIARKWLQRAQQLVLDITELLIVQAFIHIRSGQDREAQQVLTRLQDRMPDNIYFLMAQMEYYGLKNNVTPLIATYQKILSLPIFHTQLIYIQNRAARYYNFFGEPGKALSLYHEIVEATPQNPWAWHNMSIIYLQRYNLPKAYRYNKNALRIMEFVAAKRLRRKIIMRYAQLPFWILIIGAIVFVYIAKALGY